MDYETLRAGMQQAIPFNSHLGLEVIELGPGVAVVRLPEHQRLVNHVGSQHAGGLFSAGEAASGGAFVGAFAERMGDITPLASGANIEYKKIARGPITATARLDDTDGRLAELDTVGVTRFAVGVELTDGSDELVAEMTVYWHVKQKVG